MLLPDHAQRVLALVLLAQVLVHLLAVKIQLGAGPAALIIQPVFCVLLERLLSVLGQVIGVLLLLIAQLGSGLALTLHGVVPVVQVLLAAVVLGVKFVFSILEPLAVFLSVLFHFRFVFLVFAFVAQPAVVIAEI